METKVKVQPMEALEAIKDAGTSPNKDVRDATGLKVGQALRQGDVYLARIPHGTAVGKVFPSRQIVSGETLGSRHVVEGDATMYERVAYTPAGVSERAEYGPVIVTGGDGATLTHPEHAHFKLGANATYQSWVQIDAETQQRVVD